MQSVPYACYPMLGPTLGRKYMKRIVSLLLMVLLLAGLSAVTLAQSSGLLGDADGDGEVTITDATVIQRSLARYIDLTDEGELLADVDRSGSVTISDATYIQRHLARLSDPYGIALPYTAELPTVEETADPTAVEPTTAPLTEEPTEEPTVQPTVPPTTEPSTEASSESGGYTLSEEELEVIRLTNAERVSYGLSELSVNVELSRIARLKSQDMHDNNYFDHTSPTYGTPFEMMRAFGISYRAAAENIAMGYRTPESVVEGWMNSSSHRANILSSSYTQIGVGFVSSGYYWTQQYIG